MAKDESLKEKKSYGAKFIYDFFYMLIKVFGLIPAYVFSAIPIFYFTFLKSEVPRKTYPYLKKRFPKDNFIMRRLRLMLYYFRFGECLIDQAAFGFMGTDKYTIEMENHEEIKSLLREKSAVVVMSHVGFWELSFMGTFHTEKKLNLLVQMNFDKDRRKSFYDFAEMKDKLAFIDPTSDFGGMIEAVSALMRGEIVGVPGDRAEAWRSKKYEFLGEEASFPVIAGQLAAQTESNVFVVFGVKDKAYNIRYEWKLISKGISENKSLSKEDKIGLITKNYVKELEAFVMKRPYMWFNFFDFWA